MINFLMGRLIEAIDSCFQSTSSDTILCFLRFPSLCGMFSVSKSPDRMSIVKLEKRATNRITKKHYREMHFDIVKPERAFRFIYVIQEIATSH